MRPSETLLKKPPSGRCDKRLKGTPDFLSQAEGLERVTPDAAEDSRVDSRESCLEATGLLGPSRQHSPRSDMIII